MIRPVGALPLVILTISLSGPIATAAKAPPASRRVELVTARPPDPEGLQRFEVALREGLARKHLGLASVRKEIITPEDVAIATSESPEEAGSTVARVFIEFTSAAQATLFLIDPRRSRIHVRHVMLDHGLDAVARESLLFVIEQSVDAILEGREIGVSREEYQRSLTPPSAAPPPPVPASTIGPPHAPPPAPPAMERVIPWLVAGGYDGVPLGPGTYQHAAKVVLIAELARVQVAGAARVAPPVSVESGGVQAQLWTAGVSVSAAAKLIGVGKLSLRAGVGAGLDVTHVAPTTTTSDLQATAAFWAAGPLVRGFAELDRRFGALWVSLAIGAEAHLLGERYTVRTSAAARAVFVPYRIRPEAVLLVGWAF